MMNATSSSAESTAATRVSSPSSRHAPDHDLERPAAAWPTVGHDRLGQQLVGADRPDALGRVGQLQQARRRSRRRRRPGARRARTTSFTAPTLGRSRAETTAERHGRRVSRVPGVNDRLVWIDCEMTGLDLGGRRADRGGGPGHRLRPQRARRRHRRGRSSRRPRRWSRWTTSCATMHETSGLLDELDDGITLAEAEEQVLAYIKEHCPDGSRPPLAGNTVATDRAFLARDMPDARGVPALPDRRRLLDQGARRGAGTRAPTSARRPSAATTGRSPTSRRASRSCATTGRRSSCPRPARTATRPRRSRPSTAARSPAPAARVRPPADDRVHCSLLRLLPTLAAVPRGRHAWWV